MYLVNFYRFIPPRFFAVLAVFVGSLLLYRGSPAQGVSATESEVRAKAPLGEEEAFQRSAKFFSQGNVIAALTVISEYEKHAPGSERLDIIHALSTARLGRNEEADRIAETLEHSEHKFSALFLRGALQYEKKDFERAEEYFFQLKSIAERNANDEWIASATFWLGETARARGEREKAIAAYKELVANFPSAARADDALLRLGELYERSERYDSAAISYLRLINTYPSSEILAQAQTRLASVFIYENFPPRALEELDRADHIVATRGAREYDEERTSTSVEAFSEFSSTSTAGEQILTRESGSLRAYLRAEALIAAGKNKEALVEIDSALRYESALYNRKLRFMQALAFMNLGNFEDARARFTALRSESVPTISVQSAPRELHDEFYVGGDSVMHETQSVQQVDDISAQSEFYEAVTLERLGRHSEAATRFESIARNDGHPMATAASFQRASMLLAQGKIKEARAAATDAVRGARRNSALASRVYLVAAEAAYADGDVDEARKFYGESVARSKASRYTLDDVRTRALLGEGVALVTTKKYAEAVPVLQQFIAGSAASSPHDVMEGYFWLGEAFLNLNLFANAREAYSMVLTKFKGSDREEDALYALAWAHYRAGELGQASRAFSRLANAYPIGRYAFEANARAGDAFYLLKQYDNASAYYDAALKVARDVRDIERLVYARYQLAQAEMKQGQSGQALSTFKNLVATYPSSTLAPNAQYNVGWIAFSEKQYEVAIEEFQKVLSVYGSSALAARAQYSIADAYYNLGRYEEALQAYRTVLERYPESGFAPDAINGAQYALDLLGRGDEASRMADEFLVKNPNSSVTEAVTYKKGDIFFTGKKYSDAAKEYEAFVKRYPTSALSAQAYYWRGKSELALGNNPEARAAFEAVILKFPASSFAADALYELASLDAKDGANDQSRVRLQLILERYPESSIAAQAGFDRARMFATAGMKDSSKIVFALVKERYAGTEFGEKARLEYAKMLEGEKKYDAARKEFEAIVARRNDLTAAQAQLHIAELYITEKKYQEAVPVLTKMKTDFAAFPEELTKGLFLLGESYEHLTEWENARDAYNAVLSFHEDDTDAVKAKAKLKKIAKK